MNKIIFCDIDDTILKPDPRRVPLYKQARETGNWDLFYNCDYWDDEPINWVMNLLTSFIDTDYTLVFLTARNERVGHPTSFKLLRHDFDIGDNCELLMRSENDWRPSPIMKVDKINKYLAKRADAGYYYNEVICIDDNSDNIQAFKDAGFKTLQV